MEATSSSSPLTSVTSLLSQDEQTRIGTSSVVVAAAGPALDDGRDVVDDEPAAGQVGPLREQLPRELQRVRHDLAEVADADVDLLDPTSAGVALDGVDDGLAERQLVHPGPPPRPALGDDGPRAGPCRPSLRALGRAGRAPALRGAAPPPRPQRARRAEARRVSPGKRSPSAVS